MTRHLLACLATALLATSGCAFNATGVPPRPTLIFEYSIEGSQLYRGNNLAYYFVVNARPDQQGTNSAGAPAPDTAGNEQQAPLVNGPAPSTYRYPDPRSYLPWIRDEAALLDVRPVAVPNTYWTDYFALYEQAGQFVMWQGRKNEDGTINEFHRQLQEGREWGVLNNKTIQLTIPMDQLNFASTEVTKWPPQIPANLAVALRNIENAPPPGYIGPPQGLLDRWGQVQNFFFTIPTTQVNQNLFDTVSALPFPENLPAGVDLAAVNLTTITYRVVREQ